LDHLLQRAVTAAQAVFASGAAADAFRGLYLEHTEIERLLTRKPGVSPFDLEPDAQMEWPNPDQAPLWLSWLRAEYGLTVFDLRVLVIALAPEIDLRYERLYAYLQDDVSRKRPSVDLALNLLCSTPQAKLERRVHFLHDAALLRDRLIHLIPDPNQSAPPLLAQGIKLDEAVLRLVLGHKGLDARLAEFCVLVEPANDVPQMDFASEISKPILEHLAVWLRPDRQAALLHFAGPAGAGQRSAAETIAAQFGMSLLCVDLTRGMTLELEQLLPILLRTARQQNALLYFDGFDTLASGQHPAALACLVRALARFDGVAILVGALPCPAAAEGLPRMMHFHFGTGDFRQRRACWDLQLQAQGVTCHAEDINLLAARYRLTSGQIADAVALAFVQAHRSAGAHVLHQPTLGDLCAGARAQVRVPMTELARKIEPRASWTDLVVLPETLVQLRELCDQVKYRHVVYEEWGFGQKLTLGKGVVALFSGQPGTGKTMASEIIARELALDLYKIDLSQVVSKYIGETEKNLDRVFNTAERANAILLFDEADTLFGQRSQVRDAHDRYANLEVGYLLQKMEEYDGLAILSTNLAANMDAAFIRRLAFRIEFAFPTEPYRELLWHKMFTATAPQCPGLDFPYLARQFKLAGGHIKNVVLAASFLAAAQGQAIGMKHMVRALFREFQKMGKTCVPADFGEYGGLCCPDC
jgi:hypothetical protein